MFFFILPFRSFKGVARLGQVLTHNDDLYLTWVSISWILSRAGGNS